MLGYCFLLLGGGHKEKRELIGSVLKLRLHRKNQAVGGETEVEMALRTLGMGEQRVRSLSTEQERIVSPET